MNEQTEFSALWRSQKNPDKQAVEQVIIKAGHSVHKFRAVIIRAQVILLLTLAGIACVIYRYRFSNPVTIIGLGLIIIAICLFLIVSTGSLRLFYTASADLDSKTFLSTMLRVRKKQQFIQGKLLTIYFILLSAGLFLYMLEFVGRMTHLQGFLAYLLVGAWIILNWFYYRPRAIKKQQAVIDKLIGEFEVMNQQF